MQRNIYTSFDVVRYIVVAAARIVLIAIVGVPFLIVLIYFIRANTIYAKTMARYRLEVAVEIDGKTYYGSKVYQIDYNPHDWLFDISEKESPAVATKVRGEALEIDLEDRGEMLILLSYNDIHSIAGPLRSPHGPMDLGNFVFASLLGHYGFAEFNGIKYEELETLTNFPNTTNVTERFFLPILYVPNRNKIDGMRLIFPKSTTEDSMPSIFGNSCNILYEKITTTTDPVTRTNLSNLRFIDKILSKSVKFAGINVDDWVHIDDSTTVVDAIGNYKLPLHMGEFEEDLYDRQYLYDRK